MLKFSLGHDYTEPEADHKTFGIDQCTPDWGNRVVVYGSRLLRDSILQYLNSDNYNPDNIPLNLTAHHLEVLIGLMQDCPEEYQPLYKQLLDTLVGASLEEKRG